MPAMKPIQECWFEVSLVFSAAEARAETIDQLRGPNLELVRQQLRTAAVAVGCSMMESVGLKADSKHSKVIFSLRNACMHNGGDLSKNKDKKALKRAQNYLEQSSHEKLNRNLGPFFDLKSAHVALLRPIYLAVTTCLKGH